MSALLRVWGKDFDPDAFFSDSVLEPSRIFRKGDLVLPRTQPEGRRYEESGANVIASQAGLLEFTRQIEEAIAFLERYKPEFERLRRYPGVEDVTLDFGIAWRDVIAQFDRVPQPLIRLAGELGLAIELSHYPVDPDEPGPDLDS